MLTLSQTFRWKTKMRSLTRPVLSQIEESVRYVPGWSPLDQLFALYTLTHASAHLPGDVLELGSWCGRSAAAMGLAVKTAGRGKLYCIDLFPEKNDWYRNADGTYSLKVKIAGKTIAAYDDQTVWAEPFKRDIAPLYRKHKGVLGIFKKTIKDSGLQKHVAAFRGDLSMFIKQKPKGFKCRLAFIDAHHSYDAVSADIARLEPFLVSGAWVCFDDAFTTYRGVDQAIEEHIILSGKYDLFQQLTRKLFVARKKG